MDNNARIDLAFTLISGIIRLFKKHQQGDNVSDELNELLAKTTILKNKEMAIANSPLVVEENKPTTEELIAGLNKPVIE